MSAIPERLFFKIGEVAHLSGLKPHVLRFWESEFPMIAPEKSANGQRVYKRTHVETILLIKQLLYQERYSIEGARRRIKELKKLGELKTTKAELAGGRTQAPAAQEAADKTRAERQKSIRALAEEIRGFANTPLSEIFRERPEKTAV